MESLAVLLDRLRWPGRAGGHHHGSHSDEGLCHQRPVRRHEIVRRAGGVDLRDFLANLFLLVIASQLLAQHRRRGYLGLHRARRHGDPGEREQSHFGLTDHRGLIPMSFVSIFADERRLSRGGPYGVVPRTPSKPQRSRPEEQRRCQEARWRFAVALWRLLPQLCPRNHLDIWIPLL